MKQVIRVGFAGAAAKILSALGRKTASEIVRRSSSLVYKWSDPDLSNSPTVTQALEMDVEYVSAGHGSPPFLTAYSELLNSQLHRLQENRQLPPSQFMLQTIRLLEEVVALLKAVQERTDTDAGGNMSPTPRVCSICLNLRTCREIVAGLTWSIDADQTGSICPLRSGAQGLIACGLTRRTDPAAE